MTYWPGINPDYLAISWPDNGEPPPFAGKPCMRIPCPSFMDEHDLQARDQIDLSLIEVPDNPTTQAYASDCERLLRRSRNDSPL